MITIKNAVQIEKMRAAGALLRRALDEVASNVKPGVTTGHLNRLFDKLVREGGGIPSCLGYEGFPASVCTSVDSQVVHGIPSDKVILREGQIISLDGCVLLDGFQADSALTVPVGRISKKAQALIDVTRDSFYEALRYAREGYRVSDIGHAVQHYVEERGYGAVRALTGHGIGREMHEDPSVPNFGMAGHGVRLRRGMTICIEPMITAGDYHVQVLSDGWTVVTSDRSLAAHYEHTVLITQAEPELLTLPDEHRGEAP